MFRRLHASLPTDPYWPPSLPALGFQINSKNQFVKINPSNESYDTMVSVNEGVSEAVRKVKQDDTVSDAALAAKTATDSSANDATGKKAACEKPVFFDFYYSDSNRVNEVRKEAVHIAAREAVSCELEKLGVKEVYISADGDATSANVKDSEGFITINERGVTLTEDRPVSPHVSILVSGGGLAGVKQKKNVVIVVGEHSQDLGILAYRTLMHEGGIEQGSVVGLARKLNAMGVEENAKMAKVAKDNESSSGVKALGKKKLEQSNDDHLDDEYVIEEPFEFKSTIPQGFCDSDSDAEIEYDLDEDSDSDDNTPGLIVLNPGQLLYSQALNTCMSQVTWLARPKQSAIGDPIRVDSKFNKVAGHRTPGEHITRCLSLLPDIVGEEANLFMVGIGDGAEDMLYSIDSAMCREQEITGRQPGAKIGFWHTHLNAFVFVEPAHQPSKLRSEALKVLVAKRGRSWEISSEPKGTIINTYRPFTPDGPIKKYRLGVTMEKKVAFAIPSDENTKPDTDATGLRVEDDDEAYKEELEHEKPKHVSCPTFSAGPGVDVTECILPVVVDDALEFFKAYGVHGTEEGFEQAMVSAPQLPKFDFDARYDE